MQIPPAEEQLATLIRGTVDLHPIDDLRARLQRSYETQTPLRVKTGFDPTAADLHLGHTVLIEKMAQFQRFGHDVVFLIGDYTARIGDPTGRNAMRPALSPEQIAANAATYTEQCFKILDRARTTICWNSTWLDKLSFAEVITLASQYNLGRILERRDFRERFDAHGQIALHELLYPLVQGYDSVVLNPDIELGGHDQIFNLNVGRHLMSVRAMRPQIVLTVKLLVGLDGVEKMSKSKGNHIGITEPARDIFAKTMSISDETMRGWIPLLTGADAEGSVAAPLKFKKELAATLVARFHGDEIAQETRDWWEAGRPASQVDLVHGTAGLLIELLCEIGAASSKSDARRKVLQGAVSIDDVDCTDPKATIGPGKVMLRVGKRWLKYVLVR